MHISAGTAMWTYSAKLGKRKGYPDERISKGQNNSAIVALGMACFWIGTIGIVGSPAAPSVRTVVAITSTSLAGCMGGITWSILDYHEYKKGPLTSVCNGIVAGLIAISSGAGFVPVWAGMPVGIMAGVACNFAKRLKRRFHVDDTFDGFALHVVGGCLGNLLTALFASYVARYTSLFECFLI
jgi:Amt family ammonium transporter